MSRKAYLVLENGTVFEGVSFGAEKETMGELVFTTSMIGYLETLTDPSYFGQVVVQTFPLIGNYGVIPADFESNSPALKGYIVREWCQAPSNFRCEGDLDTFLKESGIPGICGIDTRALTRILRDNGSLNCKITYSPEVNDALLEEIKSYKVSNAVESTTTSEITEYKAENAECNTVLMDFGTKKSFIDELLSRGCNVTVVPASTTAEQIKAMNPDGVLLSSGAGNPADNAQIVEEIKKLAEAKVPMFGINLGHQLLALSQGAQTAKLKYGHRGASQPIKNTENGGIVNVSQSCGYTVVSDTVPQSAKVTFVNTNDNTCEAIDYTEIPAFSTQFYPEKSGGAHDTSYMFDRFVDMMKNNG